MCNPSMSSYQWKQCGQIPLARNNDFGHVPGRSKRPLTFFYLTFQEADPDQCQQKPQEVASMTISDRRTSTSS